MKKEKTPDIRITDTIKINMFREGTPISSLIAAAEPVLVFDMRNKARKEKDIVKTLIIPNMKRNSS